MRKGISNVYWLFLTIAVLLVVGFAWVATASNPVQYTAETGRKQAVILDMYISAEETRLYAEEAIKLSAFYALSKMNVTESDCFDKNHFDDEQFIQIFTSSLNEYIIQHPLENEYSDILMAKYGPAEWMGGVSLSTNDKSMTVLNISSTGDALTVSASPDSTSSTQVPNTQILNSNYFVTYNIDAALTTTIYCSDYHKYMGIATGGSF